MSVTSTVNQINVQTLTYLPAALATIQAVEALAPEGTTGPDKLEVALTALGAGSAALSTSPNANIAGIAQLINLGVLVGNLFKRKPATAK